MSTTPQAPDANTPEVTVVVPSGGRIDLLDRCLDALLRQTMDGRRVEIIVVDDHPRHNIRQLVAVWRASAGPRGPAVVYLPNPGPHGPAAARNRGWQAARAPIIAFTDDDTVPSPSWLSHAMDAFDDNVDALCGHTDMPLPGRPTDYQREARLLDTAEFVTTNCFCRKSVLQAAGGFDERFGLAWRDDSDLYFRLLNMHANIIRAPHALVIHPVRPAPWGISLLQLKKIAFDALLYKKHPLLYRQKIGAPRWDYYAIVGALACALLGLVSAIPALLFGGAAAWALLTGLLCHKRLRGTSRSPSHIAEMVLTSALIPPLAVFWRLRGAIRFRVRFT